MIAEVYPACLDCREAAFRVTETNLGTTGIRCIHERVCKLIEEQRNLCEKEESSERESD